MSDNPYLTAKGAAVVAAVESALDWLSPKRRRSKRVSVPDFTGLGTLELLYVAMRAGVKVDVVRVVEHPLPVEGVVIDQTPAAGTEVKRDSVVTVKVRHPAADA